MKKTMFPTIHFITCHVLWNKYYNRPNLTDANKTSAASLDALCSISEIQDIYNKEKYYGLWVKWRHLEAKNFMCSTKIGFIFKMV